MMASFLNFSPFFLLLPLLLLISPARSLTCTSQTFPASTIKFTNCTDLPSLKAYLHWAYNPTNSSLSIAFIAQPPKPDGWIAWGINPISTGMVGAQALVALKDSKGVLKVETFNLTSYKSIDETDDLSFKVVDSKAESDKDAMKIFATLGLPANMKMPVNHVWQVGGSVTDEKPDKHEFGPDNLKSKGTLDLVKAQENATAGGAPGTAPGGGNKTAASGGSRMRMSGCMGVYGFLVIFGILVFGF